MSRVTVILDRYICDELEELRQLDKTRDYSRLLTSVERCQIHANAMEAALYAHKDFRSRLEKLVEDKKMSDQEFRKKVNKTLRGFKNGFQ